QISSSLQASSRRTYKLQCIPNMRRHCMGQCLQRLGNIYWGALRILTGVIYRAGYCFGSQTAKITCPILWIPM
ncbi:hypothetical protein NL341_28900, partial [Klebsiella pneumoniae]|nr:hypothetical protein [Klebsiella pneumoniae]